MHLYVCSLSVRPPKSIILWKRMSWLTAEDLLATITFHSSSLKNDKKAGAHDCMGRLALFAAAGSGGARTPMTNSRSPAAHGVIAAMRMSPALAVAVRLRRPE